MALSDAATPVEPKNLEYRGLKLAAWLRDRSMQLLRENEFATTLTDQVIFAQPVQFLHLGKPVSVTGIEMTLQCKRVWVAQTVKEDVSKGMYNHVKQVLLIPNKETWSLDFDNRNRKEIEPEIEPQSDMPPGTLRMDIVLYQPACGDGLLTVPASTVFLGKRPTQTSLFDISWLFEPIRRRIKLL